MVKNCMANIFIACFVLFLKRHRCQFYINDEMNNSDAYNLNLFIIYLFTYFMHVY